MTAPALIQKLWNYYNILLDDRLSYVDHVEQPRTVADVERPLVVVEELETVVNANLRHATRLRQSIFQRAFSGIS